MSMDKQEILHLLGFDLESSRSVVLKSILMAQEELGEVLHFDDIREKTADVKGEKPISRPFIYRMLGFLEDSKILKVERDASPNEYIVNLETVVNALDHARTTQDRVLRSELEMTNKHLDSLQQVLERNMGWLADRMYAFLVGKSERTGSKTVRGVECAHNLIDDEIYGRAVKGDLIRLTMDWFQLPPEQETIRQCTAQLLAVRGVKNKMLEYFPENVPEDIIKLRFDRLKDFKDKGFEIGYRVARRHVRTYQGVALNRDALILMVSEEPLTMVYIPRSENEALINETIESFDKDFEEGIDYLDYYRGKYDD